MTVKWTQTAGKVRVKTPSASSWMHNNENDIETRLLEPKAFTNF